MALPLTDDERQRIIVAMREGKSRNEIAREFGRSGYSITAIAKEINHDFNQLATKKAVAAAQDYDAAARLELNNKAMKKAAELLDTVVGPRDFKDWAIGYGVVLDKRRLEETTSHGNGQLPAIFEHIKQVGEKYAAGSVPKTGLDDQRVDGEN